MFLAAGEVTKCKRELMICDHPQIGLDTTLQKNTGLRLTPGENSVDRLELQEVLDNPFGLFCGDQNVQVANRFSPSAEASSWADLGNVRVSLEMFD